MAFNRDAAMRYAADHWNTVCDDELIYLYGGTINTRLKKRELRLPDPDSWERVRDALLGGQAPSRPRAAPRLKQHAALPTIEAPFETSFARVS